MASSAIVLCVALRRSNLVAIVFIFLQLDAENDRAISEHVLRGHRFRKPGSDMEPEQLNGASGEGVGQDEQTESPEEAAQVR